jgi:hypothetical protein
MRSVSVRILSLFAVTFSVLFCLSEYGRAAGDLTPSEARKLIAHLAGIELPSNAVRIKEISPMGSAAVVIAQVETAFRFQKKSEKWQVIEIRTGDRNWEEVETLVRALNNEKTARARAELNAVGASLEAFKRERGFYVESDSESALMDHLSPRYMSQLILIDPWHQPYVYKGSKGAYVLKSNGADKKADTPDDIIVSR